MFVACAESLVIFFRFLFVTLIGDKNITSLFCSQVVDEINCPLQDPAVHAQKEEPLPPSSDVCYGMNSIACGKLYMVSTRGTLIGRFLTVDL